MPKISPKHQRFIEEYMIDLNATQAAIRAGYSVKTAGQTGDWLVKHPQIARRLGVLMAERSKRTGISADRVLEELAKIAFANITDISSSEYGGIQDDADKMDTAAIQRMKVRRVPTSDGEIVERDVTLYDKTKALEQLGKHLGMFNDKTKVDAEVAIVIHDDLTD